MSQPQERSKNQLAKRIIISIHILLYLILAGIAWPIYSHAKTVYNTASPQGSYISCALSSTKESLAQLGTTGKYTVFSKTLNGNRTGDDLLALKACNPDVTDFSTENSVYSGPNVCPPLGSVIPAPTNCVPPLQKAFAGYDVHFVHNNSIPPAKETLLAIGVNIVIIEVICALGTYIAFGKIWP
jgi:hypothetical protein